MAKSTEPDNMYFDVLSTNTASINTEPPVFSFTETRSTPFLSNPSQYEMSVVRFTVDTQTLPVLIPVIQPDQGDINLTEYSVTLEYEYNGVVYFSQAFIEFQPQDSSAVLPSPPNTTANGLQDLSTGYYNVYSYSYFTYLVYLAFENAYSSLVEQLTAVGMADPDTYPPFIIWDGTSSTATMYTAIDWYNLNSDSQIKIYMNAPLYALFSSLPARMAGYTGVSAGRHAQIYSVAVGSTNVINFWPADDPTHAGTPTNFICTYSEYSVVSQWSPYVSFVFTSQQLPIVPNQVSTPIIYLNGSYVQSGAGNATVNIITDLATENAIYKPSVYYVPSAEYRMVSLNGNSPLYTIDIQVWCKLRTGVLVPFRLGSGGSCSLKILFRKR